MALEDIPEELKKYKQWINWRYEAREGSAKPTKVPLNPHNGKLASVTNPDTWGDFKTALANTARPDCDGVGFVITDNDPYCFIDLDDPSVDGQINQATFDRQRKIFETFASYTEFSPSNKGVHIIVKAKLDSGRRRDCVEIYTNQRFMTMTGNVYLRTEIQDRQELATILWEELGAVRTYNQIDEQPQTESDADILNKVLSASNGQKASELMDGHWQSHYASQSEADFALIDIIAFYTKNKDQIIRIFHETELGKRAKATRKDYLNYMLNRAFDNDIPPVDLVGIKMNVDETLERIAHTEAAVPSTAADFSDDPEQVYSFPPGLVGEIANFVYQSSPRPVQEISLVAAIGMVCGIAGRSFVVSNTGLNQYLMLLAKTGRGKEAIKDGIERLINEIKPINPSAEYRIGPAEFASPQGLLRYLNKYPCFVSILGEFGFKLQQLSSIRANENSLMLKRLLLDCYMKSGRNGLMRPSVYADESKNIPQIVRPCVTLIGESTPTTFYGALNEESIAQGLLPRFTIIEYDGMRVPFNEDHAKVQPSRYLVESLVALVRYADSLDQQQAALDVTMDEAATELSRAFGTLCDRKINEDEHDTIATELWNRAQLKALRLAAVVAVGLNPGAPVITGPCWSWAQRIIEFDVKKTLLRFQDGNLGNTFGLNVDEATQTKEVKRAIQYYFSTSTEKMQNQYRIDPRIHMARMIPLSYFQRRLITNTAFRMDRQGATGAIKRILNTMVAEDTLRLVDRATATAQYGTTQLLYMLRDTQTLEEDLGGNRPRRKKAGSEPPAS